MDRRSLSPTAQAIDGNSQPHGQRSLLNLDHVSKVFQSKSGHATALQDVNLNVTQGEFLSLVGPSGCGKSTLLRVIGGLLAASQGTVLFNGQAVEGPPDRLGMVFQDHVLLPWRTVLQNALLPADVLKLPLDPTLARVKELFVMVGLQNAMDKYPNELSGGMRQRCALVRALAHDPMLLLMDEPFGALDAMTREKLNVDLEQLWMRSRNTVVFVTHSIAEAVFLSDRVVVMRRADASFEANVVADVPVNLERPRSLKLMETPDAIECTREVRRLLEMGEEGQ